MALLVALSTGCQDKAAPSYAKCVQLSIQEDVGAAWKACNAAIAASPTSEAGQHAAAKLVEMEPKYDEWQATQAKAAAKAEAEERTFRAERMVELRKKVHKYKGHQETHCRGKGLGHSYQYTGGLDSENEEVALADGCWAVFPFSKESILIEEFCCP